MRPLLSILRPPSRDGARRATPARRRLRSDDGFTLFETLVATVVLVVGLTTLLGLLDTSTKATYQTRAREGATNLAREILEDARVIPYAQLDPNSVVGELQAMNGLENESGGSSWQIKRRGVTYTITLKECSIDDPKDGSGSHASGVFCNDPGETTGTADNQPEDLKRLTVDVKWSAIGRNPDVQQVETYTSAGEAPGLIAYELKLSFPKVAAPTAPVVVTQPASNTLTFTVQSPKGTEAMDWALDGVRQTNSPTFVKGTEWTFSWSIPLNEVSDGAYQISAQAIDATGIHGPPISITVTLIRATPAAPKVLYGGFNEVLASGKKTKVAELEWQANSERNVIGYRVYNAKGELVCPSEEATLSLAVTCINFNLAPKETETDQEYSVVALYRKAEGEALSKEVSNGPAATFKLLAGPPTAPERPTSLEAVKNEDGSVTLKWPAVTSGSTVVFYRIYRGSEEYTSRYATVSPASPEFTDTDTSTKHKYWVTAVNANLTESSFIGPVEQ